jgi:anaerobic ribonucleoside-triphosphate reductase activating protein
MYWRLNCIQYPVYNLGPGKRVGVWVQGCSLHCLGCVSKSLWPKKKGNDIEILKLACAISEVKHSYDGITITGGEPFDQYESLITFCALVKRTTNLNLYCFSGYTLTELDEKHPDRLFMKYLDFLLDGQYKQDNHDNKNVRGSTNQKLYQFIDGQPVALNTLFFSKAWSLAVSKHNQVFMAGIPKEGDLRTITRQLGQIGIDMRFK